MGIFVYCGSIFNFYSVQHSQINKIALGSRFRYRDKFIQGCRLDQASSNSEIPADFLSISFFRSGTVF